MSLLRPVEVEQAQARSLFGRASALVKLGVALAWLIGLATTVDVRPGIFLGLAAIIALPTLGGASSTQLRRGLAPLAIAAVGVGIANLVFAGPNADPAAHEVLRLGPLRLTSEGAAAAAGLIARLFAVAAIGVLVSLTTSATSLADALVQQAHLSPRFAYGALAAYEAVPGLAADFTTIRDARRVRGLPAWYPRILISLLVRAIRRGDQLALGMDARGFGTGPRTTYRPLHWGWPDLVVGIGGILLVLVAVLSAR